MISPPRSPCTPAICRRPPRTVSSHGAQSFTAASAARSFFWFFLLFYPCPFSSFFFFFPTSVRLFSRRRRRRPYSPRTLFAYVFPSSSFTVPPPVPAPVTRYSIYYSTRPLCIVMYCQSVGRAARYITDRRERAGFHRRGRRAAATSAPRVLYLDGGGARHSGAPIGFAFFCLFFFFSRYRQYALRSRYCAAAAHTPNERL